MTAFMSFRQNQVAGAHSRFPMVSASSLSDLETNLNKTASKVPQSQSNHFAANFEVILEPIDRFEGLSPTGS